MISQLHHSVEFRQIAFCAGMMLKFGMFLPVRDQLPAGIERLLAERAAGCQSLVLFLLVVVVTDMS